MDLDKLIMGVAPGRVPGATPVDVMTPLEEIEAKVHERFGQKVPTRADVDSFLSALLGADFGAAELIALAGVILQGYQIYAAREQARLGSGGNCPTCRLPAQGINKYSGRWECAHGHSWK